MHIWYEGWTQKSRWKSNVLHCVPSGWMLCCLTRQLCKGFALCCLFHISLNNSINQSINQATNSWGPTAYFKDHRRAE